jgi:hypothetical protein
LATYYVHRVLARSRRVCHVSWAGMYSMNGFANSIIPSWPPS